MDRTTLRHGLLAGALAGILIGVSGVGFAQKTPQSADDFRFVSFSVQQGLPHSCVNTFLQDSDGFLWIGTLEGLSRFDGVSFETLRKRSPTTGGISGNRVYGLVETSPQTLWIGFLDAGLDRLNLRTNQVEHVAPDPDGTQGPSSGSIRAMILDRSGMVWLGHDSMGVDRMDPRSGRFEHFRHVPGDPQSLSGNAVRALFQDRQGRLWVGTNGLGVDILDEGSFAFRHIGAAPERPDGLPNAVVYAIEQTRDGTIWLGTFGGGLVRLEADGRVRRVYHPDPQSPPGTGADLVRTTREDSTGQVWVGTEGGLYRFDPQTESFQRMPEAPAYSRGLSDGNIRDIFEDRFGILWFGTLGGGVNKFTRAALQFHQYNAATGGRPGLSSNSVWAMFQDRSGALWAGTAKGVDRVDRSTGRFEHFVHSEEDPASPVSENVTCFAEDDRGNIWMGTYGGGMQEYERATGKFRHFRHNAQDPKSVGSDLIRALSPDGKGGFWIATRDDGLEWLDPKTATFRRVLRRAGHPELTTDHVQSVLADESGVLWIGTFGGGMVRFDPETGDVRVLRHVESDPASLINDFVYSIVMDRGGHLWLATEGGAARFDRQSGRFRNYTTADGLTNNVIYAVLEDKQGRLWMPSHSGMNILMPNENLVFVLGQGHGLVGFEYRDNSAYQSPTGEMFFGGANGFSSFIPEEVEIDRRVPRIVLTSVKVMGKAVPVSPTPGSDPLELSYKDRYFSAEFSAIDTVDASRCRFAYKLEGFDADWVQAGTRRFATYTNLDGGRYTLRVKGSNSYGVWNEQGIALHILVRPPWWATWWFRSLAVVGMSLAITAIWWSRTRRIREQSRMLARLVDERTNELKTANGKLEQMALNDALTGLRNRHYFRAVIQPELQACESLPPRSSNAVNHRRLTGIYGLLLLDIDGFKSVNDTYGHDAGDAVLRQLAAVLSGLVRRDDHVTRWGGEEFLVSLKDTDPDFLPVFAERVRAMVEATLFRLPDGREIHRTCSIGLVQFPFSDDKSKALSVEQCVSVADLGLYRAKTSGKNRVVQVIAGPRAAPEDASIPALLSSLEAAEVAGLVVVVPAPGGIPECRLAQTH